ncbi:hypothetical protein MAR_003309 [Mya arenaria]|uniref:Uncharacterized protein n=1 Tax=Mya arenaria TaxID=6604 RepID=A0ABY7GEX3_MYAAR|nr:hypothetical protein MAR_003309 [Mya arenaria]
MDNSSILKVFPPMTVFIGCQLYLQRSVKCSIKKTRCINQTREGGKRGQPCLEFVLSKHSSRNVNHDYETVSTPDESARSDNDN